MSTLSFGVAPFQRTGSRGTPKPVLLEVSAQGGMSRPRGQVVTAMRSDSGPLDTLYTVDGGWGLDNLV